MFIKESKWIINNLKDIKQGDKIADIGCNTFRYRAEVQPYINSIYKFCDSKGAKIVKIDFDKNTDADIFLDITSKVPKDLIEQFDFVLATNLLEHIEFVRLSKTIRNLSILLKSTGHLVVTVPFNLPIHNRPIDNGLRPDCKELTRLFAKRFIKIKCETWVDDHYREPYISNPELGDLPVVIGGLFVKRM